MSFDEILGCFTGKKILGVSLRDCWIGSPLHFLHELVEIAPLESHQRAHTLAKVGVHIDVGTHVVGECTKFFME